MNVKKMRRTLKDIKTLLYGRMLMILLGFVVQFALLFLAYYRLSNYSFGFYLFCLALSAVALVDIYSNGGNPDMKLSWMLPIALFPVLARFFSSHFASTLLSPNDSARTFTASSSNFMA